MQRPLTRRARQVKSAAMFRRCGVLMAALTFSGAAAGAQEEAWDGAYGQRAKERADFTLGATVGAGLGGAVGAPNEVGKIGNERYESSTGLALGSSNELWLGGALTDWLVLGVGFMGLRLGGSEVAASGYGFMFRVETFPFLSASPALKRLGFFGSFGAGGMTLEKRGSQVADGGALSVIEVGALHETFAFGGFRFGPAIQGTFVTSDPVTSQSAFLLLRAAFYAGP